MPEVHICEVGPRDGLQSAKHLMPTAAKKAWISALAAAGLKEIEVGSFVPPKLIPAMADTGEIVKHSLNIPGLTVVALAPNLKGYQRAVEAGAHKVTFPVSASRAHSESNVRMTPDQMVAEVRKCAELGGAPIEGAVSTAFGCTLQGEVPEKEVVRLANALAAYEEGVRHFDSSMGGLGGCPFAPGASGNVVTEDLVFMFESMGVSTGVDFDALLKARGLLVQAIPDEPVYGRTPLAGLPKGFRASA